MIPSGLGSVMSGYGYTVFDTAIGRCGIAWGDHGVIGVQLPEEREIDTRRRLYRLYPEAREQRPTEWLRDPESKWLRDYPVDVPWDEPELFEAMLDLYPTR